MTTVEVAALGEVLATHDTGVSRPSFGDWTSRCHRLLNEKWEANLSQCMATHGQQTFGPRVLYATASLGFTGAERMLLELITENMQHGVSSTLLVRHPGILGKRAAEQGAAVEYGEFILGQSDVLSFLEARSLLRRIRPAVLHLNGYAGSGLVAAALTEGVPIVQHVRVADFSDLDEQLRAATIIIAISEFVAGELSEAGVPRRKVRTIYNGFCVGPWLGDRVDRRELRARLGVPQDAWVVVMVARYAPNKRHEFLLEAARRVASVVGPSFRIVLVGDPCTEPERYRQVLSAVERTGLEKITTHVAFREDIGAIERVGDVLVLCSLREPFGNCICEAMLCGVPVVAAGTGGYLEVVKDGVTGRVVPSDDVEALADVLIELWSDPESQVATAARAKHLIETQFSRARYGREVRVLYDCIAGQHTNRYSSARP